ncbi:MAG: glutathione peroxidase [Pseudomonadota bacterium]
MLHRRMFLAGAAAGLASATGAYAGTAPDQTAHDFSFTDIDGNPLRLSQFAGKPLMVVNTASRCGFTYQYDGLQALYDRYRDRGFVLLGVPSDDFGGQELDSEAEVKHFCEVNFALDFPLTEISDVRGRDAHPFYRWASKTMGADRAPRWNFHKYLIGPDGALVEAFDTRVEPESPQITRVIDALLAGA